MKPASLTENLTNVFFIEKEFEEKILLQNKVLKSFENTLIVVPAGITINHFKNVLRVKGRNFKQAMPEITRQIKTDWVLYLKPEENRTNWLDTSVLEPDTYNIQIETIFNETMRLNNIICEQPRLFNRNSPVIPPKVTKTAELNIADYSAAFPEIEKNKVDQYIELYKQGYRELEPVLYLQQRFILKIAPQELINTYLLHPEKYPETSILELYRYLGHFYLARNDFLNTKNVLLEALKYFDNSPCINNLMGELFFKEGKFAEAEMFISKCVKLGLNNNFYRFMAFPVAIINYISHYYLGKIFLNQKEYLRAKISYENCLELYPDFKPAQEELFIAVQHLKADKDYIDELDFSCQGCGNCCRTFLIEINNKDMARILENRPDLQADDFVEYKSVRLNSENKRTDKKVVLKRQGETMECIFLKDNRCSIHHFKPLVCKVWPFSLRKGKNITWAEQHREFIKNECAHTLVKGANDPDELYELLTRHYQEQKEYFVLKTIWEKKFSDKVNVFDYLLTEKIEDKFSFEKKLVDKLLSTFSENSPVDLILKKPFIAYYTETVNFDFSVALYLPDHQIDDFFNEENLDNIMEVLEADYYKVSPLLYHKKSCLFNSEGYNFVIFVYPSSFLNLPLYSGSEIIYNPAELEPARIDFEQAVEFTLKDIYYKFRISLEQAFNLLKEGKAELARALLFSLIKNELNTLIFWNNQKNFTIFEIPFLKNKTIDLMDFILSIDNYSVDFDGQSELLKKTYDIFERNWGLRTVKGEK